MISKWFRNRRLDWIDDRLMDYWSVTRFEIEAAFGISARQAGQDIQDYKAMQPALRWSRVHRAHIRLAGFKSVRKTTPARRAAWSEIGTPLGVMNPIPINRAAGVPHPKITRKKHP